METVSTLGEVLLALGGAIATFMPLILAVLLHRVGARSGSFQRRAGPPRWVFSPPPAFAAAGVTFLLGVALIVLLSLNLDALFGKAAHDGMGRVPIGQLLLVLGLIGLAYWGAARVLRRMCALTLDLDRRTYRSVDMSGVILKARTGTWEDIAGVCVRRSKTAHGNNTFAYYVAFQWRGDSAGVYSILGGFGERDRADAYAEQVARDLHLPLVTAVTLA